MDKKNFDSLIGSLLNMIQYAVEKKDIQGCIRALFLLEEQYRCFDVVLTAYKGQKYVEQYKVVAVAAGEAYSKQQYYRHQCSGVSKEPEKHNGQRGKVVVYTCTYFSQIEVQQPEYINTNWDYICFTGEAEKWGTKEGVWEYRKLEMKNCTNNRMLFHMCRINPHMILPEYDYSIWVNPAYKITGDLELFLASYGRNTSFLAFPSYITDDMYEIMETGLHSDDENIMMRKKKLQFEKEGYPQHYGMISDNIMIRNHRDELMCKVMETWWDEAIQCGRLWSFGFNYAAWKHNFKFAVCDMFVEINSYFKNMVCDLEVKRNE